MSQPTADLETRITALERRCQRWCILAMLMAVAAIVLALAPWQGAGTDAIADVIRTRRLDVLDDQDHLRIRLAEDPAGGQRIARACGMHLFDADGAERAGFTTMADGSVVLAMDAPKGVGAPMRDRLGLIVQNDGTSEVRLIDNKTGIPVRLISGADGVVGLELMKAFLDEKLVRVRRLSFDGEASDEIKIGG